MKNFFEILFILLKLACLYSISLSIVSLLSKPEPDTKLITFSILISLLSLILDFLLKE